MTLFNQPWGIRETFLIQVLVFMKILYIHCRWKHGIIPKWSYVHPIRDEINRTPDYMVVLYIMQILLSCAETFMEDMYLDIVMDF